MTKSCLRTSSSNQEYSHAQAHVDPDELERFAGDLKTFIEELAISGSWRLFTRRVDTRKFLPAFDLRIANNLSADDATELMGKRTSVVIAERGLFIDCSRDHEIRFRPFALPKNTD